MRTTPRFLTMAVVMVALFATVMAAQESAPPVYTARDGVTMPSIVTEVHPEYTPEAKAARIQARSSSIVSC